MRRLVQKIKAGRPYKTAADVEAAVAGSNAAEGKRITRYLVVE